MLKSLEDLKQIYKTRSFIQNLFFEFFYTKLFIKLS